MKMQFSKKELLRDNQKMRGELKWCQRVIDELTAKNIELELKLNEQQIPHGRLPANNL